MSYIHHIVLTVSNIERSTDFYKRALGALGWVIRNQDKEYTEFVPKESPDGRDFLLVVGVPRDEKSPKSGFDRNNLGLDHFAFAVETRDELREVEHRLREAGIPMEDGGITEDGFGGTAIFCSDPDGMKVEFHLA